MPITFRPEVLPSWCTVPVNETITFTDPVSGKTQTIRQLNIAEPNNIIKQSGFVQDSAVVEQDLNWLFNTICNWIAYLDSSLNQIQHYAKSDLPKAKDNIGKLVFVTDNKSLAISNGANWVKLKMEEVI